jgi:hypothetical protein
LSALSVDAPVGAPPERERKISHSTPPSRDERRRRVTTVSWRTAACKPPDLPRHLRMPGLARRVRGCTANGRGRPPQPRGSAAAGAVRVTRRCSGTSSALPCRPERTGGGALAAPSTRGAPRPMGGESTELSPPAVLSAPRLASVGPSVASAASQSDAGAAAGGAASAAACPSSTMAVDALLLPRAVGRCLLVSFRPNANGPQVWMKTFGLGAAPASRLPLRSSCGPFGVPLIHTYHLSVNNPGSIFL